MASTNLTVINAALTRIGEAPISSLTDTSVGAQIANENYEQIVEAHLSIYPWKRASKTAQLSRLDPDVEGEPPEPWGAAYSLPSDLTEVRAVKVGGAVIPYEISGDVILTDAAESHDVILHYVWRADEADWPPWFREGIIRTLEALFLRGIGERHREAAEREEAARDWWKLAKGRDSQSQTARQPVTSPMLTARRGFPVASATTRV